MQNLAEVAVRQGQLGIEIDRRAGGRFRCGELVLALQNAAEVGVRLRIVVLSSMALRKAASASGSFPRSRKMRPGRDGIASSGLSSMARWMPLDRRGEFLSRHRDCPERGRFGIERLNGNGHRQKPIASAYLFVKYK